MWLSTPATAVEPRRSPRDGSAPLEQLESMVMAAHQHLSDGSSRSGGRRPPSASQRTPRTASPMTLAFDDEPPVLSLDAHMESFPLVPLPLIPRLCLADLHKCERGLLQLLESLNLGSGSDEDVQLGKYAARQLSLVQRHVEQTRARERVLQLLSGDAPVLAPMTVNTSTTQGQLGSAKALPIFLTPTVNPATSSLYAERYHKTEHHSSSSSSGRPALASSASGNSVGATVKSPLAKAAARKKRDAIEAARAMIKANLAANSNNNNNSSSSAFVITAGDHSSSNSNAKRRRRQQKKKPTAEEVEKARALQIERERERRRQEAYQRLIARQELQAEKKKKQQQVCKSEKDSELPLKSGEGATQLNGSEPGNAAQTESSDGSLTAGSSDANQVSINCISKRIESDSESDDGSEVSNCSDSDEANERAIMALQVQVRVAEVEEEEGTGEGDIQATGHEISDDADVSGSDDDAEGVGHGAAAHDGTLEYRGDPECDQDRSRPEMETGDAEDSASVEDRLNSPADQGATDEREENEGDDERKTEQQIALDLQAFISHRKSARMEQLQQQKQRRLEELQQLQQQRDDDEVDNQTVMAHSESLDEVPQRNETDPDRSDPGTEVEGAEQLAEPPHVTDMAVLRQQQVLSDDATHPAKQTRPRSGSHVRKPTTLTAPSVHVATPTQKLAASSSRSAIPRAPVKPCKDYRGYFSNFHCILTSVFEQRHALSNSNSNNNSSSSSSSSRDSLVVTTAHAPVHGQSLRIQLKLYEGWQSIMQDYATVFGGNIATPRSMLPTSGTGLSPSTAHYRINSTTRREVCDIVVTALEKLGDWDEHPSGLGLKTTWNLLWTWSKPRVERKALLTWQKVNHFQHAKALTRKDCLKKNMGKYLAMGGRMKQAYDVVPLTFILPHEYIAFVQAFQDKGARLKASSDTTTTTSKKNIWIMKPVALSRGRGISLIDDLSQVVYGEQVVIQEYIANPLLLDGYKFDLRLYVLVTSFNPLEAFFYDEGFVRICTRQYEDADLTNLFVHLTNSSIQKENQDAIQARYTSIHSRP